MYSVVVNCEKLPFTKTLGVSHFLIQLCSSLASECELIFVVNDLNDFKKSDARHIIRNISSDIVQFNKFNKTSIFEKNNYIELLPHHFQEPCFSSKSIMICHDLHVYDIGWKYNNVESVRELFKQNIRNAGAVVTHFPRTYYCLERAAGIIKKELFLTESPILVDTRPTAPEIISANGQHLHNGVKELLYPAQLQEHKNHSALIEAVVEFKKTGQKVRVLCPGSNFNETLTNKLTSLAKQKGVEAEIEFMGRVSDEKLRQLYWGCDGVIIPSLAEGGAYVAMEAIAAQKPVAVNRIDSAVQHLRAIGADVIWFDATKTESTVTALKELVAARPDVWSAANATASQRIDQMTWEKVAKKWFTLLRWLSGESERPLVHIDRDGWNIDI